MHRPPQPNGMAVEMAKEYANPKAVEESKGDQKKLTDLHLNVLKELCLFAASEL